MTSPKLLIVACLVCTPALAQENIHYSSGDLLENAEPSASIETNGQGQSVWSERYAGYSNASDIFFFDGAQVVQLTSNGPTDSVYSVFPKINDAGQVVWRTTTTGIRSDIWFYDSNTTTLTNLTSHLGDSNHPQINKGGEVVFAGRVNPPEDADIYLWTGVVGELAQAVNPADPGIQVFPQIADNGDITWLTDGVGDNWTISRLDRSPVDPSFSLTPSSVSFGGQRLNTSSAAREIQLVNTGGSDLPISAVGISGVNASEFSQSNDCASSVAIGGSCTINLVFHPVSKGKKSATLVVETASSAGEELVQLSGTGVSQR